MSFAAIVAFVASRNGTEGSNSHIWNTVIASIRNSIKVPLWRKNHLSNLDLS
jgi:hypothetical protein